MRKPLDALFAVITAISVIAVSGCANGPTLPQVQQAGQTLVTTIKTDVALYEAQHSVSPADQANITLALNSLSAANVVVQTLPTTGSASSYIQVAQSVVSAAVSVIDALPTGALPVETVTEINNAAALFQIAAGIAQQLIAQPSQPAAKTVLTPGTYLQPGAAPSIQ